MKRDLKACGENCSGLIVDKKRGIYCQHIEDKLPKASKQSVQAFSSVQIENYSLRREFWDRMLPDHEIEARLRKFGLDNFEVELVMLRYIDNMSMKDIIEAQGWISVNSVAHHLRSALRKLRKARFTLV